MGLLNRTKKLAEDEKYLVTKRGNIITTLDKTTGKKYAVEIKKEKL